MQLQRQCTTREALRSLLQARPGLAAADAARALDIDPTTAQYHLRRLVRDGEAVAEGAPRRTRYFAAGAVRHALRPAWLAAREAADLLDALRGMPGVTQSRLARELGVPRPTLAWRLDRLRRTGLVVATRRGREVHLHVEAGLLAGLSPPGRPVEESL